MMCWAVACRRVGSVQVGVEKVDAPADEQQGEEGNVEEKSVYELVADALPIWPALVIYTRLVLENSRVAVVRRPCIGFFKVIRCPFQFGHGFSEPVMEAFCAPVLRLHGGEDLKVPLQAFVHLADFAGFPLHGFQLFFQAPHGVVQLHAYLVQAVVKQDFLFVAFF